MKLKKIVVAVFFIMSAVNQAKSQVDPHFSQYYAYPLWLNPALTGVFDGSTRINTNYKNQWAGINNGYNTNGLSLDFHQTEKLSIGFNVINQSAGTAGYDYFAGYGSVGYGIAISADGTQKLHFGVQAGFINRSFDPSKLQLDDQYNPLIGFDPNLPSFENFAATHATMFDASAGIFYYDGDPLNQANLFAGISLAHITDSKDAFVTNGLSSPVPVRFIVHAGVKIKVSDFFDVTPHAIYISQQQSQIKALGVYSELKPDDDYGFLFGAMYRVNDAAIVNAGYRIKSLVIGLSYDFNTSPLNMVTNGQGGFELSLSYIFSKHAANPAEICPRF